MKKNKLQTKTSILLLTVLTACLGLASCSEYLDIYPGDNPELKDAFLDRHESEKYLFTCYKHIPSHGSPNSLQLSGCDEIFYTTDDVKFAAYGTFPSAYFYGYGGGNNSSNPYMNFWDGERGGFGMWDGIRNCNIFLKNMPLEAGGPPDLEETERKQWMAEVNILKAYYHFFLMSLYGPIPIVDKAVSTNAGVNEFKIHREPLDSVVNYIVKTIDKALPDLSEHMDLMLSSEAGRITKTVALAIKAKTLVWAASPLFNGNPDYSLIDNRGIQLFPQAADQNKWRLAADALLEAIQSANQNNITTYYSDGSSIKGETPSIETIYRLANREALVTHWNSEVIWAHYESGSYTLQNWAQPFYQGIKAQSKAVGQRQASPLHIAEQFYTANGVPMDVDKDWLRNGWYANRYNPVRVAEANAKDAAEGQTTAQLNLNRSHRFYSALGFDRGYWEGLGLEEKNFKHLEGRAGEVSGNIGVSSLNMTGYYCKKVCGINNGFSNPVEGKGFNAVKYAFPIIRLTDLKLLYAECLNELGRDYSEILPILDEIRTRSGILPVKQAWDTHTDLTDYDNKIGLRKIIQQERLNELAFEGARFWDTRRWKTALRNMNTPVRTWNVWGESVEEYYNVVTKIRPSYSFKNYLMPLKERTLIKNPNLIQNPGW